MATDDTIKTIAGIAAFGVAAWLIYKNNNDPVTAEQITRTYTTGPLDYASTPTYTDKGSLRDPVVTESKLSPGSTLIMASNKGQNTTWKLNPGDYEKLNFAQKFLLQTRIIPQDWILG